MAETLLVVGAGQMGSGIAHLAAQSGLTVRLTDQDPSQVTRGLDRIRQFNQRAVDKGRLSADEAKALIASIHPAADIATGAAGASFAIEAVVERVEVKQAVFEALDAHLAATAVIATNTS
ncbi:MAG: 3-hydroxyacyl-CoA dehydrogenase family protein, partial [Sulfobacillus sp.]